MQSAWPRVDGGADSAPHFSNKKWVLKPFLPPAPWLWLFTLGRAPVLLYHEEVQSPTPQPLCVCVYTMHFPVEITALVTKL